MKRASAFLFFFKKKNMLCQSKGRRTSKDAVGVQVLRHCHDTHNERPHPGGDDDDDHVVYLFLQKQK
jgi:hypothetical protein